MDLDELFYRHQISVVRAAAAPSLERSVVHRTLASGYAARIAALRLRVGGTPDLEAIRP